MAAQPGGAAATRHEWQGEEPAATANGRTAPTTVTRTDSDVRNADHPDFSPERNPPALTGSKSLVDNEIVIGDSATWSLRVLS